MLKDIVIAGAGGFGRETYYLIKEINKKSPTWNIRGFINDVDVDLTLFGINDVKIIGTIKDYIPSSENEYVGLGISSPSGKEIVVSILKEHGAKFATLISPLAIVNENTKFGKGTNVTASSIVGDCCSIGDFVNIAGSMIGQDVSIGDFSTTTGYTNVVAKKIGRRVFAGSHSVILADVEDDAFICVGSIVLSKVKKGVKVMGNPAKKINF